MEANSSDQADVIELRLVGEIDRRDELAALVDGEPVVAAVARQPGDDVIGHLREGERDHDEIDAARAQRQRADHQRKQRRSGKRHRPLHEAGDDALMREDADGIAADAEIGGVAEAHHAAVAEDEVEAHRGEREDQDAREQRQQKVVAARARYRAAAASVPRTRRRWPRCAG